MPDPQFTTEYPGGHSTDGREVSRFEKRVTTDFSNAPGGKSRLSAQSLVFRDMLRLRVAVVQSLAVVIWGTILVLGASGLDPLYGSAAIGAGGQTMMTIVLAIWTVAAVVEWSRKDWTHRQLRILEFTILIPHAGMLVVTRLLQFTTPDRSADFLEAAATHNGFGWLAALVAWGLVFPHPWKRMLAMNGILVACPLIADLALILTDSSLLPGLLLPILITAEMLLFGFVVSLFGSHRIASLQAEVADVREQMREARELGPYSLIRLLGAGGMGEVYLAEHRLLKRPCAVKLIRADRAGDRLAMARFEREAQATARLKHPNTVDVFDFGRTEDGTFYYVMEFLDGLSLDEVVRRHGPLPAGRVLFLLRQLCGALREAHQAGLIHRDIKPSNILLCRHGGMFDVVKLVDFGLVVHEAAAPGTSHMTQAGSITGTPDYISPEQADGTGAEQRSDLYSLGATAYFLLTGRPPFKGKTVLDILFAHRNDDVPAMASRGVVVSNDLEALVTRLLAKSPDERPSTAEAVEAELRTCADFGSWSDINAEEWWVSHVPAATDEVPSTS